MEDLSYLIPEELQRIRAQAKRVKSRKHVMNHSLKLIENLDGDILEFGVFKGESLKMIIRRERNKNIYAFDSFEGLPEAWPGAAGESHPKGHFNLKGKIPKIKHDKVTFIKGWFDETLPKFIESYTGNIVFIHIDSDIYSSAKTILNNLKDKICKKNNKDSIIILFDELIGYKDFELNEIKAWIEFTQENPIDYEYLYFSKHQVSLQII
jgi:hypothetical protein